VSTSLPIPVIALPQVLTVAIGAPGLTGVIATVEARLQGAAGRGSGSRITTWPSCSARRRWPQTARAGSSWPRR
jgi:tartrate dehydratase alpha subunit/fumarate hydratase class I-like protein